MLENIQVYVDGSYNRDTDLTGAGVVILYDGRVLKKSFLVKTEKDHSWNIDGECHATLEALKICSGEVDIEDIHIEAKNITINYDYIGIEKWINREWKIKSKISKLYVKEFNRLVEENDLKITFNKVKSHSGDEYNEVADKLARERTIKK